MLTNDQILDLLERAYNAGCFSEVHKMIKSSTDIVIIEKVIEKSQEKADSFSFDFSDIFGND